MPLHLARPPDIDRRGFSATDSNRRVRTRTHGGVAGVGGRPAPYADPCGLSSACYPLPIGSVILAKYQPKVTWNPSGFRVTSGVEPHAPFGVRPLAAASRPDCCLESLNGIADFHGSAGKRGTSRRMVPAVWPTRISVGLALPKSSTSIQNIHNWSRQSAPSAQ